MSPVYYCQDLATITVRVVPKGVEVTTATRKVRLSEAEKASVATTFDGKTFIGCGRRLDPVPSDSAR